MLLLLYSVHYFVPTQKKVLAGMLDANLSSSGLQSNRDKVYQFLSYLKIETFVGSYTCNNVFP